jgi:hypothetical protein
LLPCGGSPPVPTTKSCWSLRPRGCLDLTDYYRSWPARRPTPRPPRAGLDNCDSLARYGRYSCASRGRAPSCWYWRICIGPTAPPATCWPSWSGHFTAGLPPFNRGELAEHPAAVSGKELPSTAVERIFARSEGNPFHAEELLATSNKAFSEWGQVFGDDVLASAILDRLLHHCDVISINGPSYRLKGRLKPSDGGGALE